MKTLLQFATITICLLWFSNHDLFAIADKDGPKTGDIPPPLVLSAILQGPSAQEISWDKLKGKVVVLEFWATWCGPCVKAIPHLNSLAEQFKDKPVVFLSVTSENEGVVRTFLKQHPIKSWIGVDDYEVLNKAFHVRGIPHTVIINAEGRIAAITHPAKLEARHLEEVLGGNKCSLPEPTAYTLSDDSSSETVSSEAPSLFEISIRERKLPEKIRGPTCMWSRAPDGCGFEGKLATVESGLNFVFGKTPSRMALDCKLAEGFYDFKLQVPAGHESELEKQFIAALRTSFGLEVKRMVRQADAYVLAQVTTNAPGFHRTEKRGGGGQTRGGFRLRGTEMETIVDYLELELGKPVFDETNLKGLFDADLKWELPSGDEQIEYHPKPEAVVEATRSRLGLQLTPVRRTVEFLEVRKVPVSRDE